MYTVDRSGLSARSNAGLKVRQPLAKALAHLSEGQAELSDEVVAIVADELNIKAFEFAAEAGDLVSYRVLPVNQVLGPRFGAQFPKVRAALAALDPASVAALVEAEGTIELTVDGETISLSHEEVLVNTESAEGLAVAAERARSFAGYRPSVKTPTSTSRTASRPGIRLTLNWQPSSRNGAIISRPRP